MVNITALTGKKATLSMLDPNIRENSTKLLVEEKLAFNMTFQEISKYEFLNGERNSSIILKIKELDSSSLILQSLFVYYGPEESTVDHLHINRYVGVPQKDIHFITVWSDRVNDFCEFFINNYKEKTSDRFIL